MVPAIVIEIQGCTDLCQPVSAGPCHMLGTWKMTFVPWAFFLNSRGRFPSRAAGLNLQWPDLKTCRVALGGGWPKGLSCSDLSPPLQAMACFGDIGNPSYERRCKRKLRPTVDAVKILATANSEALSYPNVNFEAS
jgi:hypothetical protein